LVNFGNSTDDRFDSDLKESYTKQVETTKQAARLCNVMRGLGCLVDKWIWDDADILVDDNVLPTMYRRIHSTLTRQKSSM
jgi:hypothetical protein